MFILKKNNLFFEFIYVLDSLIFTAIRINNDLYLESCWLI